MARQSLRIPNAKLKKVPDAPLRISFLFMLLAYGFVTVLTPNLRTLDSNGPKFLTLSLLNLMTFIFLFTRKELKTNPHWYYAFFSNSIGLVYSGLMIVSLLSFFKAINVLESVLHFTKIFTTFSAAYLVSILIMADKRNILYLCIAMTLLLIFDSLTVFSGIHNYINGNLSSIIDVKSVYSNKNILASSVFVKIPFALWLMTFRQKWQRTLGIIGTFLSILATFFLSTRAFYLGTFALTIFLVLFFVTRFIQSHDKYQLRLSGIYLILLVSAFLIFSTTQHFMYPKTQDKYVKSFGDRLSTINVSEGSAVGRLEAWKRSWHVFKDDPMLGVGLGNWKIATLKEENLTCQDYSYFLKAHNDFIETTTETGIFGGLLFIALFILMGWAFIKAVFKKNIPEWMNLLFLPAFGLVCYSFDAFFNFPQDRPEIQTLFALYFGMAVTLSSQFKLENPKPSLNYTFGQGTVLQRFRTFLRIQSVLSPTRKSGNRFFGLPIILTYGLTLTIPPYFLYQNVISLKLQRIIYEDLGSGKLAHPASLFLNGFPNFPNLSAGAEPISVMKAKYLINEKKNDEAIELLKKDNSNPFDARKEYFLAWAYSNLNQFDSSIFYSRKMYCLKPNQFNNISLLCEMMQKKGLQKEGEAIIDKYLNDIKNNKEAWLYASSFYSNSGKIHKAASLIDTAALYYPSDPQILKQKATMDLKVIIGPNQALYDSAFNAYNAKKYNESIRYLSELVIKMPAFTDAHKYRAMCFFFIKEYAKSNLDLDFLISNGVALPSLYNLRGVNYGNLGNLDEACYNYKIAADMGDKDGLDNYSKFCKSVKK